MAKLLYAVAILLIWATISLMVSSSTVEASGDLPWIPTTATGLVSGNDEFDLDSEINRRILATSGYISYGALQRNTVPCSRRGASYYNCQPGAQANPYSRGCSAITRCRS
ncbi:putative rapid ALkalinization Factor [Rosa chinensis]|uniref:Putative rapid ALkalinization Factor n=1 Tax=Rosa chinensis TaxID=74649 RepID=A0A2P6R777_ROSCH|nr:protein RALF-like 33 [Rosa chinensis]PRQ42259.1 putative rapid ALkalinization Factor [Rosa chinensis]